MSGNGYELKYVVPGFDPPVLCNPNSNMVLVAGWTPVERLLRKYKEDFAVIGSLYGQGGVEYLVKNLLWNNHIRVVFILQATQQDKASGAGEEFLKVYHEQKIYDWMNLEMREALSKITVIYVPHVDDFFHTAVQRYKEFGYPETAERGRIESPELNFELQDERDMWVYGLTVTGNTLKDIHSKGQNLIKLNGNQQDGYRELLGLTVKIPPEVVKSVVPTDELTSSITSRSDLDVAYTYGDRLSPNFYQVISRLRDNPNSRRAYLSTWEQRDGLSSNPPCLTSIHFMIQDGRLCLVANYRSEDFYQAFIGNVQQLVALLRHIADILDDYNTGWIIMNIDNAHIYNHCIDKVTEYSHGLKLDPAKISFVRVDDNLLVLGEHGNMLEKIKIDNKRDRMYSRLAILYPNLTAEHYMYLGSLL